MSQSQQSSLWYQANLNGGVGRYACCISESRVQTEYKGQAAHLGAVFKSTKIRLETVFKCPRS